MNRIAVSPTVLRWARERAGLAVADLDSKFPHLTDWEAEQEQPTMKQLEAYAKAIRVPFGYLFLPEPPKDSINAMIPKKFIGSWTIDKTSAWDSGFLHMIETAKIEIHPDGSGRLHFGCVEADIDCEPDAWSPKEILHFSFEGSDEGDPVSGRGSVKLEGARLLGNFAFHLGDRSDFKASKRS